MKKSLLRRVLNRLLHLLARNCPGAATLRPFLHRLRGVAVSKRVWIGDDVYLENEYPELVQLHEGVSLSIKSVIIAHTRGPGRVIIERNAFIGPGVLVVCPSGKTLRVGEGAVVSVGSVVTASIPPGMIIAPPRSVPIGRASVPYGSAKSLEEFIAGMEPLRRSPPPGRPGAAPSPPAPAVQPGPPT
jgi:hypothetical protein